MKTEYKLIKDKKHLKGSCYFEFLPGKYKDVCWNEESVYLKEDCVAFFEYFLHKVSEKYDHYAFTEFNSHQLSELINLVKLRISEMKKTDNYKLEEGLFSEYYRSNLYKDFTKYKNKIIQMLEDLVDWLIEISNSNGIITVMGI